MTSPQELYDNAIMTGVIYAQVKPRIEMLRHLDLDIRSQSEVRVAAQIVLMYQCDEMLRNGQSVYKVDPFQASHAITPRSFNRTPFPEHRINQHTAPNLSPEETRPVLDELFSRGWESALHEESYVFNRSDGLVYAIDGYDQSLPDIFDPVILLVTEPKIIDRESPTKSDRKALFAFEQLEHHLTGDFGLLMKRFDPRNLIH